MYFPNALKTATIVPVFKSGDKAQTLSNYRLISLISSLAKSFEKVIHKQLPSFVENEKLFFKNQYGFRTGESNNDATTRLTTQCKQRYIKM